MGFFKLLNGETAAPSLRRPVQSKSLFLNTIMTLFSCAIAGNRRIGRPFLEASIANRKSKVLYDTGADVSCIDEKEFRKIPVQQRPSRNLYSQDRQFLSASGNALKVKGAYNIPVTINGKQLRIRFT